MSLPNYLVIGAAKAGTTSLRTYLDQHPEIFVTARGEPSFFAHEGETLAFSGPGDEEWADAFVTGLDAYRDLFAGAGGYKASGEISPRYLHFEKAPERIAHHVPEARLIAILRHPVDRAYSHYLMNRGRDCEPAETLSEAIAKEAEREAQGWGWDWRYVGIGLYHGQMERYYSRFPESQIKVFLYEDLKDQKAFFKELFTFLGVDARFQPDTSIRHRKASLPKSFALQRMMKEPGIAENAIKRLLPAGARAKAKQWASSWNTKTPEGLDPEVRRNLFERHFAEDCRRTRIPDRKEPRSMVSLEGPRAGLESAYRLGMPGYVLRDWEVIDYQCHELPGTGLWFRGPAPEKLEAGGYFTAIGAAQTFGCFCDHPYPALLEKRLGVPALNLGYSGAGPGFFLRNDEMIRVINESAFCIVQVMSGRSTSNSLLDNPEGLAYGRRRSDGTPATAERIFDDAIAHELARIPLMPRRAKNAILKKLRLPLPAVRRLVEESRQNWCESYRALLDAITTPTILFWFSTRTPDYRPSYHRQGPLFGKYPQLIDTATLDQVKPLADTYVECVSTRGSPQPLFSRFTGKPATVSLEADTKPLSGGEGASLYQGVWRDNRYYPSPEMQMDAAGLLEVPCRDILRRAVGTPA